MTKVAGCVVRNGQDKYLLVQEKQEKVYGLWNIPAGHVDEGETPRHAAMRETKEESGYDVWASEEPFYELEMPDRDRHFYVFLGRITGGDLVVQESEILDAGWFSFNKIEEMNDKNQIREQWIFEALKKAHDENLRD